MDRFIGYEVMRLERYNRSLKSNMDRFIGKDKKSLKNR